MKTAISLPDKLFAAAERLADHLGLSRSQRYQRALAALDRRALVERAGRLPDAVMEAVGDGLALVVGAGVVPAGGG